MLAPKSESSEPDRLVEFEIKQIPHAKSKVGLKKKRISPILLKQYVCDPRSLSRLKIAIVESHIKHDVVVKNQYNRLLKDSRSDANA